MPKKKKTEETEVSGELSIADEAIYFVVNQYLMQQSSEETSVVKGVPPETVEAILSLYLDWAKKRGYIKDGNLDLRAAS